MKSFFILITISALFLFSCDEDIQVFEDVYVISTQTEADSIKGIIGDAIFNIENPEVGFKGDIEIVNPVGAQNDPIVDLSLFDNYKFWIGNIRIESDDITNLSSLRNLEQIRDGLEIVNCANLTSVTLPSMALIARECIIIDNPQITSIDFGSALDIDVYDNILIDSLVVENNAALTTWVKGLQPIDFRRYATIISNPNLTSLEAFSEFSMPTSVFNLELFGTSVNADGVNPGNDSLIMPRVTNIIASLPGNDYSWLDRATDRIRFEINTFTQFNGETFLDTVTIDSIQEFIISGEVEILEVCDLQNTLEITPLEIFSTSLGPITEQILDDQCPE